MDWFSQKKIDLVRDMVDGIVQYLSQEINTESFLSGMFEILTSAFRPISVYFYEFFDYTAKPSSAFTGLDGVIDLPTYINAVYNAFPVGNWLAASVLLILFMLFLVLSVTGPSIEKKDDVKTLCVRLVLSVILIASCKWIYGMIAGIANDLIDIAFELDSINSINNKAVFDNLLFCITQLILTIVIIVNVLKLLSDIIEKYMIAQVLIITAPASAAAYVSKATAHIFKNHLLMYISTVLNLFLDYVFISMFCRGYNTLQSGGVKKEMMMIAFLKFGLSISSYLKALGFNTAQTGRTLMDSITMSAGSLGLMLGRGIRPAGAAIDAVKGAVSSQAVKNGDFGLFGIANGFGKKTTDAQNMKAFTEAGGFDFNPAKNSSSPADNPQNKAAIDNTLAEFIKKGNYSAASGIPDSFQTDGIKKSFMDGGNDAFKNATGISASSITQATVDRNGNINGIAAIKSADGKTANAAFSVSEKNLGYSGATMHCADGVDRGISLKMNAENYDALDGMSFNSDYSTIPENSQSTLASLTGANINKDAMKARGVTTERLNGDTIEGYNKNGDLVSMYNIKTKKGAYTGINDAFDRTSYADAAPDVIGERIPFGKKSTPDSARNYNNLNYDGSLPKTRPINNGSETKIGDDDKAKQAIINRLNTCQSYQNLLNGKINKPILDEKGIVIAQRKVAVEDTNGSPVYSPIHEDREVIGANEVPEDKPQHVYKDSCYMYQKKSIERNSGEYALRYKAGSGSGEYKVFLKIPSAADLADPKSNIIDFGGRYGTKKVTIEKVTSSFESVPPQSVDHNAKDKSSALDKIHIT